MSTYQADWYPAEPGRLPTLIIVTRDDAVRHSPGWHEYDINSSWQPTNEEVDRLLTDKGWRRVEPWERRTTMVERVTPS